MIHTECILQISNSTDLVFLKLVFAVLCAMTLSLDKLLDEDTMKNIWSVRLQIEWKKITTLFCTCVVIFVVSYYIMMCRIIRAHMVCWEMKAVSCWTPKHGRMLFKFTYQLFISFPKFILYDFTECFRYSIYHSTHLHSSEMTIGWILWKMCSVLRTI